MNIHSVYNFFIKVQNLLKRKHKVFFLLLIFITILLSIVETIGISSVMPFISAASDPSLLDSGIYRQICLFFNINDKNTFILYFGIFIIAFNIFRALYNIFYIYIIKAYSNGIYKYFANNLFKTYLTMPYKIYVQKNTSEFLHILSSEARRLSDLIFSLLQCFSELFTVLFIYIFMLTFSFLMTLALTGILLVSVIIIFSTLIRTTKKKGIQRQEADRKFYRTLTETFGNLKYLKIKDNNDSITKVFNSSMDSYINAEVVSQTLEAIPRFILEGLGFSLLIAMVLFIVKNNSSGSVLSAISIYALGLYRILPSAHKILGNINRIVFTHNSLEVIHKNINQETDTEGTASVSFNKALRLENVCFSYAGGNEVLHNINVEIRKGEKAAVVGESGGGKSTLIDLICGIYRPGSGRIFIDDQELTMDNIKSWKSKIGYIPQSIYLFDGTVAENVSLGSKPENERIQRVLETANIWEFLSGKSGLNTPVGEGGIQLSGGQKQRIGIARALYDDPDILILDEATSALDNETESRIMDEIYNIGKDKTLIIIAHRLSTVQRCDRIIELEKGSLKSL